MDDDSRQVSVVITGAANGIGAAIARQLVGQGRQGVGLDTDVSGLTVLSTSWGVGSIRLITRS